jgi:competence ComEA-like helix-hairpin-helix protein
MRTGFLTKEERLVFVTLSVCLVGGGLFQLVSSVFELPEAIRPPNQDESSIRTEEFLETGLPVDELGRSGEEAGFHTANTDSLITYREYTKTPAGKGASSKAGTPPLSGKLDLNKATPAELEALPGIGPALAARIIAQRKAAGGFRSVEDLLAVRGIGEKTLARFRQWVYVSSPR